MKIKEITEQRVDEALPAVAAIWVLRWVIAKGAWPFLKWVLRKFGTKLATGAAALAAIDQGWEWVKGQIGEEMAEMLIENKFEIGMAVALTGAFCASGPEIKGGLSPRPLIYAVIAAFGFGGAITFIASALAFAVSIALLWLVKDGGVEPYLDDLDSYRKLLLSDSPEKSEKARERKQPEKKKATREQVQALRSEVRKCEERVAKLEAMREKLSKKLADPALYEDARRGELDTWNRKYAEVMGATDKAETMWEKAVEAYENSKE